MGLNLISAKYDVWEKELESDVDREFLLEGIKHGFRITDIDCSKNVKNVNANNHPSVNLYHDLAEKELLSQISCGNYITTQENPIIVSPMAAILKEGKDEVRLIHDASRPVGDSLNDYALPASVHYETIDNAYKLARPNTYLCKVDLKGAYRSVAIHPNDYHLTGLQFTFAGDDSRTYLYDVRLPFGSSKGPMIFHRLSQAVKRMMYRRGFCNLVVYLDDFLCIECSYDTCLKTQHALLSLLIRLGFQISWGKVQGPSQCVEFLGVIINTICCTVSLSEAKLHKLQNKLKVFHLKKRATKRQLQSLAGSLNWACQAIRGGRFFLRRILDSINRLKSASHKCKLSEDFHKDLKWWITYLHTFNGTLYYRDTGTVAASTDACMEGAGMFSQGMWYYVNWERDFPNAQHLHINYYMVLIV